MDAAPGAAVSGLNLLSRLLFAQQQPTKTGKAMAFGQEVKYRFFHCGGVKICRLCQTSGRPHVFGRQMKQCHHHPDIDLENVGLDCHRKSRATVHGPHRSMSPHSHRQAPTNVIDSDAPVCVRTWAVVRYVFLLADGTDVLVAVGKAHNHPSLPVESSRLTIAIRTAVADAVRTNPNHSNRSLVGTFDALVHDPA